MTRPRQAKKNRSSRSRVQTGAAGRTKAGKKKVNFLGNDTIRERWDRKLTLTQNYEKLGLSVKLAGRSGGIEKRLVDGIVKNAVTGSQDDSLTINGGHAKIGTLTPGEVKVIRDADGKIIEIVEELNKQKNPLNDPLDQLDMDEDLIIHRDAAKVKRIPNPSSVVSELEAQAAAEAEELERKKKPRKQSSREEEWIAQLVNKYGDDYTGMFRDRKLNPMQQSEGDIKKRVKRWNANHDA